jgi:uncharacterized protein YjaG (DUF416 family)
VEAFEGGLERLDRLENWKQVAFMALTGARMLPNYARFFDETGFGDPSVLDRFHQLAWTWVETAFAPDDVPVLISECEVLAPDTEQYHSRYTSAALDAANVTAMILEAIVHPGRVRAIEAAALARDTVDLFIQETLDLNPNAPNFEDFILNHDLMQQELRHQREDLELVMRAPNDRATVGSEMRVGAARITSGSLGD